MFTGLVEARAEVVRFERRGAGARLGVRSPGNGFDVALGDSIAVSGVCLTAAAFAGDPGAGGVIEFDLSAETLARTWFGDLAPGRGVNLERALRLGDRLGGHLVSGHVDGGGVVTAFGSSGDWGRRLEVELDLGLERYTIDKGSITLDGVSLTVVAPRGRIFCVALIPLTLSTTTLGELQPGQRLNIEVDAVGKWIEHLIPARP